MAFLCIFLMINTIHKFVVILTNILHYIAKKNII